MINSKSLLFSDKIQPFIRHCWEFNIYKKTVIKISFKEKFINLLMIDGKKSKAYKLFNKTGILTRKKILQNNNQKLWVENGLDIINKVNILFSNETKLYQLYQKYTIKVLPKVVSLESCTTKPHKQSSCTESLKNSFYKKDHKENLTVEHQKKNIKSEQEPLVQLRCTTNKINEKKVPPFQVILNKAIINIKPSLEVRKVRIAGMTYLVPAIIAKPRQETLAIKWIIESARKRKRMTNLSFAECLSQEIVDAFYKQGHARQKRDELHKLAEANRAYIRYRWW